MTTPAPRHHLASATFHDDEPVYASLPGQIPDIEGPTFGRTDCWPGTCVRKPANRVPASWKVPLPAGLRENLLVREMAFCLLNPTHPALRRAGIFLKANRWGLRSAARKAEALATLLGWANKQGLPDDLGQWQPEDWQAFIDSRTEVSRPGTVRGYVSVIRHLVLFAPVLTGISPVADPWPGKSDSGAADCPWSDELSTSPIPPEIWWPLLRAAWAYIDRFAPSILARRELKQAQPLRPNRRPGKADELLERWLAAPGTRIPLTSRPIGPARVGEPMWNEIGRQVLHTRSPLLFRNSAAGRAQKAKVTAWAAETGRTFDFDPAVHARYWPEEGASQLVPVVADQTLKQWLAEADNLIPVHPHDAQADRSGRPNWTELSRLVYGASATGSLLSATYAGARQRRVWVLEVARDPARIRPNDDGMGIRMLRAACYVFVAALTAMRDSEIKEITRGAVTQHYGAPAIRSRKVKRDPARPHTHWWITAPVAQAIAVAEQVTWHETRVFTSVTAGLAGQEGGGYAVDGDIDDFVAAVNANRHVTGLQEIPPGLVRPHMFRRTMAVLAAQEPDGEIALGLQLKHAARRALSNRLTLSYGKADTKWAKEFDNQMERAAAQKLVSLLQARRSGQTVAVGPGATRFHAGLDKINSALADEPEFRAQIADERLQATLLQSEFADLHLGTVNHCLWSAPSAECQNQLPTEQRGQAPLLGACQPSRCRNSVLTLSHERIWRMEETDLVDFLKKKLSRPLREQAENRLFEVRATNIQFDKRKESI